MSDITPKYIFKSRREFIKQYLARGLLAGTAMQAPDILLAAGGDDVNASPPEKTPEHFVKNYNNYYEFSTNKEAIAILSQELITSPWDIQIDGLVHQPLTLSLNELNQFPKQNRTYRFRCVEGWSMVVPWSGILLKDLLARAKPKADAKFVRFESLLRPSEMIGQRRTTLPWPYVEGLRLDEALHPLTLLATGMYGEPLAKQNGAPVRLIVPWKYGFKSTKAIVKITLENEQTKTTWNDVSPNEYGFYANVNPDVAHPRWSQRRELPLGQFKKIKTLPFNGYENEVAHLYRDMDLSTYY